MTARRLGLDARHLAWPARAPARAAGDLPRWLGHGAVALAVIAALVWFGAPFLGSADGRPDLAIYADDFFYYLRIVERVLAGQGFTFDGITRTNGFHPLWMAVLLMLGAVAPPSGATFFVLLHVVLMAATLTAAFGCYRMLRETFGYAGVPALTGAVLAGVQALMLARSGMETTLALPLIFLAVIALGRLLAAPSSSRALAAALLASGAILARLDVAILLAMLGCAAVLGPTRERLVGLLAPRVLAAIALGVAPLVVYLATNLMLFDGLVPLSGQAKQLSGLVFNPTAFVWFAWSIQQIATLHLLNPIYLLTAVPLFALVAMLTLSFRRGTIPQTGRESMARAIVAFPVVYFTVIGVISDWSIWIWYMYPVVPATAVAAAGAVHAALSRRARDARRWHLALPVAAGLAGFAVIAVEAPRSPWQGVAILEVSRALAAFAAEHPGRYAMGDRAGAFGFLTDQPVVQLEGLVGDPALIASIRARRPLLDELAARGIDYYVGSRLGREGQCWRADEPHPHQAGQLSPRMTGLLCMTPVFSFTASDRVESAIFDVRAARAAGETPIAP